MFSIRNVAVAVSGGVDSAVAALILKNKGFNVLGVFMNNWDLTDEKGKCSTSEDLEDAKYVCDRLKIPFHEVNFVKEYWNEVFLNFINDYESGMTPNPDILCNKFIKFKALFDHSLQNLKVDAVATGHYARTSFGDFLENYQTDGKVKLLKAKCPKKDQTFFLSQVPQQALKKTMFPLGNLSKEQVKKIAVENGLEKIAGKPESTGICFIGSRNFQKFMPEYVAPKPGQFINIETGKVEGVHEGIHLWTLGQRVRLSSKNEALYVFRKNPDTGDIIVAPGYYHPSHFCCMFITEKPFWIADPLDLTYKEEVDFRFQHVKGLTKCDLIQFNSEELLVILKSPLRALTPGQFAVFYKQNECLGSAKITKIGPSEFCLGKKIPMDFKEYPEDNCRRNHNNKTKNNCRYIKNN